MPIPVRSVLPEVTLQGMTAEGLKPFALHELCKDRPLVVLFFPAAFSGVCTDEFCDRSGHIDALKSADATVVGVSRDLPFAQAAWAKQEGIAAQLLCDLELSATHTFDVELPGFLGLGSACRRAAFVIDTQGVVRYSEAMPTPKDLPDFAAIKSVLQSL